MIDTSPRRILHALRVRFLAMPTLIGITVGVGGPLAPSLHAISTCDDVSGRYEVLVDLPGGGPTQMELELVQDECEITGFVGAQSRIRIQDGVVEGSTASFTFQAPNQGSGGMLEIHWRITVDGDGVTGTFSHDLFGSIEVVGTRVER